MENASKALLMAAGVLISIAIISMLLLVSNSLTSYQQQSVQTQRETQIYEFNKQFEGYNRKGVRGNELYSLIGKVIDYNIRQSDIGQNDQEFEPMQISFTLKGMNKNLTKDDVNRIFKTGYEQDGKFIYNTSSNSDTLRTKTVEVINGLKNTSINNLSNNEELKNKGTVFRFTEASLDRLVTGYDKIFVESRDYNARSAEKKAEIFLNFNSAFGADFFVIPTKTNGEIDEWKMDNNLWTKINDNSDTLKETVNTYYEYVYFKRAIFNCIEDSVVYSSTGRIIKMEFEFTGKFN